MERWTIRQLNSLSDLEFAAAILIERRNRCTNACSPLSMKLSQAARTLLDLADKEKKEGTAQ